MNRLAVGLIVSMAAFWAAYPPAAAEVFVLSTGGRVEGELLNPDETPRQKFVIQTSSGGRITLDRTQVEQVLHTHPEVQEYERIRPSYPDTVEGQWALAEWCAQQGLTAQRRTHLRRIIELDPDHVQARGLLGYSQINGQWVTQEELMQQRGYVRYGGRWLTVQEIALLENRREVDLAEKEWAQNLKRWRDWLETDRALQAHKNILAIKDPHAVPALARNLQDEPSSQVRILYVDVLANIATPEAIEALAACSIKDPVEEVRLTCFDYLEEIEHPAVVAYYVEGLRSKDNRVVNLAAEGLRRMKDLSAIGPLIDALVTVHRYQVSSSNPGAMTTRFPTGGSPGGIGLGMNEQPKIVDTRLTNQAVLDALVALTGQNFSFDQQAWAYWYASQREPGRIDTRRD